MSGPAPKKKRSEIFSLFDIVDCDTDTAQCSFCKQKISFKTSNSNLKKHIQRKHPFVPLPQPQKTTRTKNLENSVGAEDPDDPPPRNGDSSHQIHVPASSSLQATPTVSSTQTTSCQPAVTAMCSDGTNSSQPPAPAPVSNTSNKAAKSQQSMAVYIPKRVGVTYKRKIDQELMKLFTQDMQPFSVVEDKGFRSLISVLNPSYDLPTRQTIAKTMLPTMYHKCEAAVREELKNVTSFCLTTNCWNSANNESFIAATCHYIKDLELKSVLLECCSFPVDHTAKNIADELKRIVDEWGLKGKPLLAIGDNASNVRAAIVNELKWNFLGCIAHKINLIVKDSLKPVEELLGKIRTVVVHFKRSAKSQEKFFAFQRNNENEPKKLLLDVATRWNSTYFMVERFCELEDAVKSTVALIDKDLPILTASDWVAAKELCKVLKPFFTVTKSLSGEKYAPASLVIVLANGLLNVCDKLMSMSLSPQIFIVASELASGVEKRLSFAETEPILAVAMFLDPRFKSCFRTSTQAEDVRLKVVNLVAMKIREIQEEQDESSTREPLEATDEDKEDDDLSPWAVVDKQMENAPRINPSSKGHVEVRRYLEEPVLERKKDPLLWWKQNSLNYPYLSKVVGERCCCLSTSVPCERLFSKGGYVLNDRRTRLSSNKVKQILFLNKNIEFVQ